MIKIFHEKQEGALCAQHCLNSLLQGDYFSAFDLAELAKQLDKEEHDHMAASGVTKDYLRFVKEDSSNYDDSGFFSIQVIQRALSSFELELIPYASSDQRAIFARQNPTSANAYICNFQSHWYSIRKIGPYWFNLNSIFNKPQYVSDTYLSMLLAQLLNDGYSIFIVDGHLPSSEVDLQIAGVDQEIVKRLYAPEIVPQEQIAEENDDEFDRALKMSLQDNESANEFKSYHEVMALSEQQRITQEEEELRLAIEQSLKNEIQLPTSSAEAEKREEKALANLDAPKTTPNEVEKQEVDMDEIRRKRLEHFQN